ncbi:hypothetical protein [Anabaena azotica]|uniref:Uncharacterized protein n=1 Tax=Anabaena azotica FACHB-119 TaxID=947527 RepID=A0ABR8CVR3_9NOST|nr:hypothetical protein [Anabaena azotica]MBD2499015.1 hypothetical protein [Anabaena azotica FACHB-119]
MLNSWFRFWWYWLIIVTCAGILFSLSLIITPDFMQQYFDAMFASTIPTHNTFGEAEYSYIKFLYGLLGAIMVGWTVALLYILLKPFRRGEIEGWFAMTASILVWFTIDSSFSVSSGFWQNAVFNVAFLVFYAIPLAATYQNFQK